MDPNKEKKYLIIGAILAGIVIGYVVSLYVSI